VLRYITNKLEVKIMIAPETINLLKKSSNLLAFSGGVDSSALFYILLERNIEFDLAIVNYNQREQSVQEVAYAKYLAEEYGKRLFMGTVEMDKFSEGEARKVRYNFFEQVIEANGYRNLLTAHQLNDKLEWFFMQFSKGAGLLELTGMGEFEIREKYRIIRPLIDTTKDELLQYLKERDIQYFIDSSNFDESYRRNYFRHQFSNRFMEEFRDGILRSFHYLEEDRVLLLQNPVEIESEQRLFHFQRNERDRINLFYIDKILKRNGYIISAKQREEISLEREVVIGGEWAIAISQKRVYIAPFSQTVMTKEFRERCRVRRVPNLIRPYLFDIQSELC
jgi:tRNA(Ile)-lysidine synthase